MCSNAESNINENSGRMTGAAETKYLLTKTEKLSSAPPFEM